MSAVRGLLFDYGGVIHDMRWDVARELEATHGLSRHALVETLYRTPTWHALQCGRGDRQAWLDEAHALLEAGAGRPLPRLEDPVLLTGNGRFVADLARGAAAVRFVRSPIARGRITGIEVPDDLPPGVRVITAADLADVRPIRPLLHRPDYVPVGQPALAGSRVNHVGEPIAAVLAPSREQAEDVAELVFVELEPEAAVTDLDTPEDWEAWRKVSGAEQRPSG